jgi:hypothetical protein
MSLRFEDAARKDGKTAKLKAQKGLPLSGLISLTN